MLVKQRVCVCWCMYSTCMLCVCVCVLQFYRISSPLLFVVVSFRLFLSDFLQIWANFYGVPEGQLCRLVPRPTLNPIIVIVTAVRGRRKGDRKKRVKEKEISATFYLSNPRPPLPSPHRVCLWYVFGRFFFLSLFSSRFVCRFDRLWSWLRHRSKLKITADCTCNSKLFLSGLL